MVDGKKVYDLIVIEEGSGGIVLFKGSSQDLDAVEHGDGRCSWSALSLGITDHSRLVFKTAIGTTAIGGSRSRNNTGGLNKQASEDLSFVVFGKKPIPYLEWVHVTCELSQVGLLVCQNIVAQTRT